MTIGEYLFSFLWGLCILFSLIGWGGMVNRVLFPKCRNGWGQRGAWGIAFSILVGGVLNLTWNISRTTILVYLGAGLLNWLYDVYRTNFSGLRLVARSIYSHQKDKVLVIGIIIVSFLAFMQYGGQVSSKNFMKDDDFQAYFVFPNKMLQTGSLGPDPFSQRRLHGSLGAQPFLQTFVLSMLSEKNINILDPALCVIIAVGLILRYSKQKGIKNRTIVLILIFFLLSESYTPPNRTNISSHVTGFTLFLSLFMTLEWDELKRSHFIANALAVALLASAICSLKSSFIPACGFMFILSYTFFIAGSQTRRKAIYEFSIATLLTGVFLLPWMISMYQSSGTLLYPLLGKGYHGSAYGSVSSPLSNITISRFIYMMTSFFGLHLTAMLMLLFSISLVLRSVRPAGRAASFSLCGGVLLGGIVLTIMTGGYHYRYCSPFMFPAVIVLMMLLLSELNRETKSGFKYYATAYAVIFTAGVLIGRNWYTCRTYYKQLARNMLCGIKNCNCVQSEEEISRYKQMQLSIPQGKIALTRLEKPFLLNFSRNTIFIVDFPDGTSPPPGMPMSKGAEPLADYLESQSIRYVAYSYKSELGYTRESCAVALNSWNPWIRSQNANTLEFQRNLRKLGETRKRIYDDGDIFVLDLLSRVENK